MVQPEHSGCVSLLDVGAAAAATLAHPLGVAALMRREDNGRWLQDVFVRGEFETESKNWDTPLPAANQQGANGY